MDKATVETAADPVKAKRLADMARRVDMAFRVNTALEAADWELLRPGNVEADARHAARIDMALDGEQRPGGQTLMWTAEHTLNAYRESQRRFGAPYDIAVIDAQEAQDLPAAKLFRLNSVTHGIERPRTVPPSPPLRPELIGQAAPAAKTKAAPAAKAKAAPAAKAKAAPAAKIKAASAEKTKRAAPRPATKDAASRGATKRGLPPVMYAGLTEAQLFGASDDRLTPVMPPRFMTAPLDLELVLPRKAGSALPRKSAAKAVSAFAPVVISEAKIAPAARPPAFPGRAALRAQDVPLKTASGASPVLYPPIELDAETVAAIRNNPPPLGTLPPKPALPEVKAEAGTATATKKKPAVRALRLARQLGAGVVAVMAFTLGGLARSAVPDSSAPKAPADETALPARALSIPVGVKLSSGLAPAEREAFRAAPAFTRKAAASQVRIAPEALTAAVPAAAPEDAPAAPAVSVPASPADLKAAMAYASGMRKSLPSGEMPAFFRGTPVQSLGTPPENAAAQCLSGVRELGTGAKFADRAAPSSQPGTESTGNTVKVYTPEACPKPAAAPAP